MAKVVVFVEEDWEQTKGVYKIEGEVTTSVLKQSGDEKRKQPCISVVDEERGIIKMRVVLTWEEAMKIQSDLTTIIAW